MTAGTGVPRRRVLPTDLLRADSGAKARPAPPSLLAAAAAVLETRLFPRRRESGCQAQPGVQTPTREQGDWVALTNPTTTPPPATPPRSPGHMGGGSLGRKRRAALGNLVSPKKKTQQCGQGGLPVSGPWAVGPQPAAPRLADGEWPEVSVPLLNTSRHPEVSRHLRKASAMNER